MVSRRFQMLVMGLADPRAGGGLRHRARGGQPRLKSWSTLSALPAPPTYRLERLPSQQLHRKGLCAHRGTGAPGLAARRPGSQRDDAAARLVVQTAARASQALSDGPYHPPMWGWGPGWGGRYPLRAGMTPRAAPHPAQRREVSGLVLGDIATQQVVYETSALHEDVLDGRPRHFWWCPFDAALSGFPQFPAGPRQVRLPLVPPAR